MKRALGYFAMGVAGALIALVAHDHILRTSVNVPSSETNSPLQVRYVNLPGGDGAVAVDFTAAAEHSVNAVVHVTTETTVNLRDPFADFFWGSRAPTQQQQRQGAGSGVIISPDGYILTNNHVIEGADRIAVHMNDRRNFEARVVGRDPSTDIAVLKLSLIHI